MFRTKVSFLLSSVILWYSFSLVSYASYQNLFQLLQKSDQKTFRVVLLELKKQIKFDRTNNPEKLKNAIKFFAKAINNNFPGMLELAEILLQICQNNQTVKEEANKLGILKIYSQWITNKSISDEEFRLGLIACRNLSYNHLENQNELVKLGVIQSSFVPFEKVLMLHKKWL